MSSQSDGCPLARVKDRRSPQFAAQIGSPGARLRGVPEGTSLTRWHAPSLGNSHQAQEVHMGIQVTLYQALRSVKVPASDAEKVVEDLESHIAMKITEANKELVGEPALGSRLPSDRDDDFGEPGRIRRLYPEITRGLRPPFSSHSPQQYGAAQLASASAHACLAGIAAAPAAVHDPRSTGRRRPGLGRPSARGHRQSLAGLADMASASASRGLPCARSRRGGARQRVGTCVPCWLRRHACRP